MLTIRKQARDLTQRDVGRTVEATCDRTGAYGSGVVQEVMHHSHQTVVLIKGQGVLTLNPQTEVEVRGNG